MTRHIYVVSRAFHMLSTTTHHCLYTYNWVVDTLYVHVLVTHSFVIGHAYK